MIAALAVLAASLLPIHPAVTVAHDGCPPGEVPIQVLVTPPPIELPGGRWIIPDPYLKTECVKRHTARDG